MFNNYHYYTDGNKVVAVSTYAGRTVRGIAKLDPRDDFNEDVGKALAAARCEVKVAKKRRQRSMDKLEEAQQEFLRARANFLKCCAYNIDADTRLAAAETELKILEEKC